MQYDTLKTFVWGLIPATIFALVVWAFSVAPAIMEIVMGGIMCVAGIYLFGSILRIMFDNDV